MAATFNRYAAGVLIASGIAVTGVLFWQRDTSALHGEDAAALNAAIYTRMMWHTNIGTNHPHGATNTFGDVRIGYGPKWANLYGDPDSGDPSVYRSGYSAAWHGMCGARGMALTENEGFWYNGAHWDCPSVWLDASAPWPADGDVIADCEVTWTLTAATNSYECGESETYTVETWTMTASNHVDLLPCAATRSGSKPAWPKMPPTNAPVWRIAGFAGAGAETGAKEWWDAIGNGTTNYKYACEQWPRVEIDAVSGGAATLVDGAAHVALSNDSDKVRYKLPDYPAEPRVTVWRTRHTAGPDGDGLEQHIAVLTRTNGLTEISCPTPVVSISKGSGAYVYFYWATAIPAGVTNDFSFEVVYQHGNLTAVHVPTDPRWFKVWAGQPYRRILVQATNNTESADGLMVYRVGYLGETNEYLAVSHDPSAGTRDITVSPRATDHAYASAGGTNDVTLTLGRDIMTWPAVTGRAAKRYDLAQAYNVATNLKRSAMFFSADYTTLDPSNSVSWYGVSGSQSNTIPSLGNVMAGDLSAALAAADTNGTYGSAMPWWRTTAYYSGVQVCRAIADGQHHYFTSQDYDNDQQVYVPHRHDAWDTDATVLWEEWRGCSLPWPSAAAYASGVVARVEIFAVLRPEFTHTSTGARPSCPDPYLIDSTFQYSGHTLGPAESLLGWAKLPEIGNYKVPESTEEGVIHCDNNNFWGGASYGHMPVRLTSITQEVRPEAPVTWDVDFRPDAVSVSGAEEIEIDETWTDDYSLLYPEGWHHIDMDAGIILMGWLVVVDWAF